MPRAQTAPDKVARDEAARDKAARDKAGQGKTARARKSSKRGYWVRQLHSWHWISSAISLVALLVFTVTGFTLNHAGEIEGSPVTIEKTGELDGALLPSLGVFADGDTAPIPDPVRQDIADQLDINVTTGEAEWSSTEAYLAMPRPGGDAWLTIDRETGALVYELTDRGWIAYFNDLHKGRNTGTVWKWFIDIFVAASMIFILTGFVLLWMHARNRPLTWPMTGLGLLIPLMLAVFFIH